MAKKKVVTRKAVEQPMSEDTKTIITVLVLLTAYPFGVIVMWFLVKWPKWAKFLITLPLILIIIIAIIIVFVSFKLSSGKSMQAAQRAYCVTQCDNNLKNNVCINECLEKTKKMPKDQYGYPLD